MGAVNATWTGGQIVLEGKAEWPEGRRLVVLEAPRADIEFLTEDQQSEDPQSIERWIDELKAAPPLPMSAEQEAEMLTWRQKVKEFNLEAVRRQMAEGIP